VPIIVAGEFNGTINCLHEAGYYTPERVEAAEALKLPGAVCLLLNDMPADTLKTMFESAAKMLPASRVAEPREIAEGDILVMSNGFMTGAVLDIDGGRSVT